VNVMKELPVSCHIFSMKWTFRTNARNILQRKCTSTAQLRKILLFQKPDLMSMAVCLLSSAELKMMQN